MNAPQYDHELKAEKARQQGLTHMQAREIEAAIAAFRQAYALVPENSEHLVHLAQALGMQGHLSEALALLECLLQREPAQPRSHQLLALCFQALGHTEPSEYHQLIAHELNESQQQLAFAAARGTRFPEALEGLQYTFDFFSFRIPVLREILGSLRFQHILEVGAFEGLSASWMMRNLLTSESCSMTCIDTWEINAQMNAAEAYLMQAGWIERHFDCNTQQLSQATGVQVHKLKGRSLTHLPALKAQAYDLAYIDGSHLARDVLSDMLFAWRLLKPGAILLCDDYLWERFDDPVSQPKTAIDAFLRVFKGQYERLHLGHMAIVKKCVAP